MSSLDNMVARLGKATSQAEEATAAYKGAVMNVGYKLYRAYEDTVLLTQVNEAVQFSVGGIFYRWDGKFPQGGLAIPQNTPEPSPAQTGAGKYIAVLDLELRSLLKKQTREALRRSYAEAGYNLVAGSFEAGGTLNGATDVLLHDMSGRAYSGPVGVVAPGTNPLSGGFIDRSDKRSPVYPTSNGNYLMRFDRDKSSLCVGLSDPKPLDDTKNYFRGLPHKNTWDYPAYRGIGSVALGRNGASFSYLSVTTGHDCVVYGAAGFAGGAGCCAGNPDEPMMDAAYGYCSFVYGKNSLALGRTSSVLGQDCESRSLVSATSGYACIADVGKTSHPNALFPNQPDKGVVSEGRTAKAHGWACEAYGDFATAIGYNLKAYNGAFVLGSAPNPSSPASYSVPGGAAIFARSTFPGITVIPDDGTVTKVGINNPVPKERVDIVLGAGDKCAIRTKEGAGNGKFALQSTLVGGQNVDIIDIEWGNASTTTANGLAVIRVNGINTMELTSTGVVKFLKDSIEIAQPGQGIKLTSPNGAHVKYLRLSNAGGIELI